MGPSGLTAQGDVDRPLAGGANRSERPTKAEQPVSLIALARDLYKVSRGFEKMVESSVGTSPVWNMLLDLVVAREEGVRVSVTSLCIASGEPTTSALRHISRMERMGLLTREADEIDHRRSWVSLTERARSLMHKAMTDIYAAGTPAPARR